MQKTTREHFPAGTFFAAEKPSSAALVLEAAQKVNSLTIKNLVFTRLCFYHPEMPEAGFNKNSLGEKMNLGLYIKKGSAF